MKRKRVVLTFREKLEILEQLNQGRNSRDLARQYGIGQSTIFDIKKNSVEILQFIASSQSGQNIGEKKSRKRAQNTDLESILYKWYLDEIGTERPVTGPKLCEKALELNKELNGDPKFKASSGWLKHFKDRHGISETKQDKKQETREEFIERFNSTIKQKQYRLEYIYNVDEININWRSLPNRDSTTTITTDRYVAVICTNATGTHKIPLVILGREHFLAKSELRQHYLLYRDEWFQDWYKDIFVPEVNRKQEQDGQNERVLLVMDSAPTHIPSSAGLKGKFWIFFINDEFSDSLQPISSGISKGLNIIYKTRLLQNFSDNKDIITLTDSFELFNKCYNDDLPKEMLVNAWHELLRFEAKSTEDLFVEFCNCANKVPDLAQWKPGDLLEWLQKDFDNVAFNSMIEIPEGGSAHDESGEDNKDNNVDVNGGGGSRGADNVDKNLAVYNQISHTEALESLETVIKWYEMQEEYDENKMRVLGSLRDLANEKLTEIDILKPEIEIQ